jgi:hypothetical protein
LIPGNGRGRSVSAMVIGANISRFAGHAILHREKCIFACLS